MKKTVSIVIILLSLMTSSWCETINIFSVLPQGMIIDKKNPCRYSFINLFDSNPDTVYAIENSKLTKNQPFLCIYFSSPIKTTGLKIKPGYFNKNYYQANNRIAKIKVTKKLKGLIVGTPEIFSLDDKMEEQIINFINKDVCREILIEIIEIYKGTKWDDTVVSDISFLNERSDLSADISSTGDEVYSDYYHFLEYDQKGNIRKEDFQWGKAGGYTQEYFIDSVINRPALAIDRDMDEDFYINYFYNDNSSVNPKQKLVYNSLGQICTKTDYSYSGDYITSEYESNTNGENITTTYEYDKNQLVKKKIEYSKNTQNNVIYNYYYIDNKVSAELKINGDNKEIYQYFYSSNLLIKKICIFTDNTGTNYEGYHTYPDSFFYDYKNNKLIREYTAAFYSEF